ncbi:PIR Superfamily Protein [Plasmodium ovale wallikeri]|uniref:PIR Superfamily Protein n=1 Tax=Plasmodium ovale wallikeri TaxID=864142 RepID=A0A1A9AQS0_PLAOA|nr:PIR Superfamily Protein [Plasmodium ovale wallikeri]
MDLYAKLDDLPSKKLYDYFNDEANITTYNHICEKISKIQSDNELIRLCTKIAKNLKYISDNKETITFLSKRCDDINYWIREQLIKNHRVKKSDINVSQIFFKFITVWEEINTKLNITNYSCNFTIEGVSMDDRTERKNFYDFYENYQFLVSKIISNNGYCKSYNEYITKSVELYKKLKEKCLSKGEENKKCPPLYNNVVVYVNNIDLSKLECKNNEPQEVYSPPRESPEDPDKAKEPLASTKDFQTQTDESPEPTMPISVGFSIFSTITILIFLYKYTPIGSLLLKHVVKEKNNMQSNMDDDENLEFFKDEFEVPQNSIENNRYHIAYQSL